MTILWFSLLFVTILTVISQYYSNTKVFIDVNGETYNKTEPNKILFSLVIIVLIILSGLRSSVGDTGFYMYSYKTFIVEFSQIFTYRDWGFNLFQLLLKKMSVHPQFFLIATSFITITLIMITLYKYSRPLSYGVFLFIAGGSYLSTMNGLRQFMVAAIIFSCMGLIIKNKKWTFFILILLLSTIHNSALIMIPVYFIVRQEAWSKKVIIFIIISIGLFIGFSSIFGMFSSLLETTQYGLYVETFGTDAFAGANVLRVIVAAVPVVLAFIYKDKLNEILEHYNIFVNFSILNFLVILFASYNWIFARLEMYFGLYNLILLPAIFLYCFDSKTKSLLGYISVVCYLVFFYFDLRPHIYASYFLNINTELIGSLTRSMYNNE